MAKLTPYLKISGLLLSFLCATILCSAQYSLHVEAVDVDSARLAGILKFSRSFSSVQQCRAYALKLPGILQAKGYPNASLDSLSTDSLNAYCLLYVGQKFEYAVINTDSVESRYLEPVGWMKRGKKNMRLHELPKIQARLLDNLENSGYPFASVYLDQITFDEDTMQAVLRVDKGPLYKVDSIRNLGSASISTGFLQMYLGLKNGTLYRKDRLQAISGRLLELPFVKETRPWNMSLMGTGSILNVYLEPKKSSEVNVLVGLLPANQQLEGNKMLVTGEANINLKSALGGGETIGLNWQQIQVKSPRLNIIYQQPYLFGTPFGLNFNFDLFKKDSSFVNVGILLGTSYAVSSRQTGTVFMQRLTTNLLNVDTFRVKNERRLPAEADVSSVNLGFTYEFTSTDYRFNPRRGNELLLTASTGTKTIRKNNVIMKLYDGNDPEYDFNRLYDTFKLKSYQFRLRLKAARFFPLTRASTLKAALNTGWFQSPSIFRNELFQIGGYKLLRGFDEESIFSSAYGVGTLEYRYLIGQNSFLSAFADYGISQNSSLATRPADHFLGAGLGMAFETKAGVFNITYAAGKRDDQKFNLRQSKIHLGYVNYF